MTQTLSITDCIEHGHEEECEGATEYREALSGTGVQHPRCGYHWGVRLDLEQDLREQYPNSSTPPSWFDPSAAGECWDEDY